MELSGDIEGDFLESYKQLLGSEKLSAHHVSSNIIQEGIVVSAS